MSSQSDYYIHQGLIAPDKYIVLKWPKSANIRQLQLIKTIVCMQLDWFIEAAEKQTYSDVEYASWLSASKQKE